MSSVIKKWIIWVYLLLIYTTPTINGQSKFTDKVLHKIYDNYIGQENNEINNGRHYTQKYRTIDSTHVFLGKYTSYEGLVFYKGQKYYTNLWYDIVNDLIIVKYINESTAFSLSLSPELVESVEFDNRRFVILPKKDIFLSFHANGLYEEVLLGTNFNLYIKHSKSIEEIYKKDVFSYLIVKKNTFILKYKDNYYKIKKRKDLLRALPQFAGDIRSRTKNKKGISKELLLKLINQLDQKEK